MRYAKHLKDMEKMENAKNQVEQDEIKKEYEMKRRMQPR
jgi:hypothetical protein